MNFELFNSLKGAPDPARALSLFPTLIPFYQALGNTPLQPVPSPAGGAQILAKYEFVNPFGSVKDRAAFGMFCEAINLHDFSRGPLKLLDASGGNMGKALAKLGQLCGIPIHLIIPDSSPPPLVGFLREAGAELSTVESRYFLLGLISRAQAIGLRDPGWTLLSQHLNLVNVAVHQYQTGQEIRRQLANEQADGWVAAVGTGGTLSGVYKALIQDNPALVVRGTTPSELPFGTYDPPNDRDKFGGAGGMGFGFRQPFIAHAGLDAVPFDHINWQESLSAMYEFYRLIGIRIGASAAANWRSAYRLAQEMTPAQRVITLFADAGSDDERDRGERYFHELGALHPASST